jgi:hypothetical protein
MPEQCQNMEVAFHSPMGQQPEAKTNVETMMAERRLPAARPDVVGSRVTGGAILLSTGQEVYYGLNDVGALVWDLLPRMAAFSDLLDEVCRAYPEVEPDLVRADVLELLDELESMGLVRTPAG